MCDLNEPRIVSGSRRRAAFGVLLAGLGLLFAWTVMIGGAHARADQVTTVSLQPVAMTSFAQPDDQPASRVRLGTYDSRAIAIAFVRSDLSGDIMKELLAQREAAQKQGDRKRVQALNEQGESMQLRRHLQGFSNAPVDDILSLVEDELALVAEREQVVAIVAAADYHGPEVVLVDVTEALVALFKPDAATLQGIKELRTRAPEPIEAVARMPIVK